MQITVRLLMEAMQQSPSQLCLIDGFPRNTDNVQAWDRAAPSSCQFVLNFAAPLDILQKRLLSRADGSRSDDNEQTIHKRFHVRVPTNALRRRLEKCYVSSYAAQSRCTCQH